MGAAAINIYLLSSGRILVYTILLLGLQKGKKKKKELLQMERYLQMLAILCAHLYSVDFVADPWGFWLK